MIIEAKQNNHNFKYPWMTFILAPYTLPIFIGMKFEEKSNQNP